METDYKDYLFGDRALLDPSEDKLDRAGFAEELSNALLKMKPPEGYVAAIFGSWGSGKTTLLQFIKHFLQRIPKADRPILVEFNPWWFSGKEDLTSSFFNQLSADIDDGKADVEEIRQLIADLSELVSHYPHWTTKVGAMLAKLFAGRPKNVPELKADLAERLRKHGRRVIVLIDDVDRLIPREILDLFRLVKAIADLPNLLYVLACDRQAVASAITSAVDQKMPRYGDSYLEKIIQLPVELPLPDRISIQGMFFQQVADVLSEESMGLVEEHYWREMFVEGIESFLKTPRDVIRLGNTLKLTYPLVEGEVNPVDFIALESLRIFRPSVYDRIRFHPQQFAGATPSDSSEREAVAAFHRTWLTSLRENGEEPPEKLLSVLFPKFESAFKNVLHRDEEGWRRLLRACSPDKLPVYFRLAVPEGEISAKELRVLAATSTDSTQFGRALLDLANQKRPGGRTRLSQALEQLRDSKAAIFPKDGVAAAVRALFNVGDELMRTEDGTGPWGITNRDRMRGLLRHLLQRLDPPSRLDVLRDCAETAAGLSTIVDTISDLGGQHGKYSSEPAPEHDRLLSAGELSILEETAGKRIIAAAESGSIQSTPEFVQTLYRWKEWVGQESLSEWLQEFLKEDANFLLFLKKLMPDDRIAASDRPLSYLKEGQYLRTVKAFIDIDDYASRIEALGQRDNLTREDRIRLEFLGTCRKE